MAKKKALDAPKQRTRAHVIASQSVNHVERLIYDKAFTAERVQNDYGYDLTVTTYDSDGFVEVGLILLQLKATDHLKKVDNDQFISFNLSVSDYRSWIREGYPVFLIVYDAIRREAYWLYIQAHFQQKGNRQPRPNANSMTLRISTGNRLDETAIDFMRTEKAKIMAKFAKVTHDPE